MLITVFSILILQLWWFEMSVIRDLIKFDLGFWEGNTRIYFFLTLLRSTGWISSILWHFSCLWLWENSVRFIGLITNYLCDKIYRLEWNRLNQRNLVFLQIGKESTPWRTYWPSWRRKWLLLITGSLSSLRKVPTFSIQQDGIDVGSYCICCMQYIVCNAL